MGIDTSKSSNYSIQNHDYPEDLTIFAARKADLFKHFPHGSISFRPFGTPAGSN